MRATDAWVNVRMAARAPWQEKVATELFGRPVEEVFRNFSADELLEVMDRAGVEKAILSLRTEFHDREVLKFAERSPERFSFAAQVDPRRGMKAIRELEAVARQANVVVARVMPCLVELPPNDRAYYPLYAKAVELGLPVSVTTGIPGPMLPGKYQDPLLLDDVCLFFPELTIVMAHGADPWWPMAIRLMAKYPRLYLMTSAYAPRHLPPELIQFMNTRGQDKVIFATDFPFLTMESCLEQAKQLDLADGVLDKYLYANAERVFFERGR